MPGRRSFTRERVAHAADAPRRYHQLYAIVSTYAPAYERPIIGSATILAFLRDLGMRRISGGPLSWRQILRWYALHDFPLLRGHTNRRKQVAPVSSPVFIACWALSRLHNGDKRLFVILPATYGPQGRRPRENVENPRSWTRSVADASELAIQQTP